MAGDSLRDAPDVEWSEDRDIGMCDYCGTEDGRRHKTVVTARFADGERRVTVWLCGPCRRKATA